MLFRSAREKAMAAGRAIADPFVKTGQAIGSAGQRAGSAVGAMYKKGAELHRVAQMKSALDGIKNNIVPNSALDTPEIKGMLSNLADALQSYEDKIHSGEAA